MSDKVTPNSSVADMPDRNLLMDRSVSGRRAVALPSPDVPISAMPDNAMLRETGDLQLPEVSQLDVIRYFTLLSRPKLLDRHQFLPARIVHDEVQPEAQRPDSVAGRVR